MATLGSHCGSSINAVPSVRLRRICLRRRRIQQLLNDLGYFHFTVGNVPGVDPGDLAVWADNDGKGNAIHAVVPANRLGGIERHSQRPAPRLDKLFYLLGWFTLVDPD